MKAWRCWRSTRSGLGVPFLITSLAINQFFSVLEAHPPLLSRHRGGLGRRCWSTIGVLILTGQLTIIVRYLQPYLPVY